MKAKIETLLSATLPKKAFFKVVERPRPISGEPSLQIVIAATEQTTGCATGNRPQQVSLCLELDDLSLFVQIYGGTGGQSVYIKPENKHLYCSRVRVPFRTPKKVEKNVLNAIKRFAENWVKALTENKENLMYQELVNYDELLN